MSLVARRPSIVVELLNRLNDYTSQVASRRSKVAIKREQRLNLFKLCRAGATYYMILGIGSA